MTITDKMQAELLRVALSVTTQEAEEAKRELGTTRAELLELHRPRKVAGREEVRCTECAGYVSGALRRMDWPCRTARALGVST
jgi:hypothetical protein